MLMAFSIKKSLMLGAVLAFGGLTAHADKGMWLLNELNKANLEQMKELGFRLTPDSLYSLDKPSVANSVVIFGRGCTGVTVSKQGLIMTNHHCGYSAIQSQSSVDHDYLRDGFVSHSFREELPIEGLTVKYLSATQDVTAAIEAKLRKPKSEMERLSQISKIMDQMIKKENKRLKNEHKEVIIVPYYAGNKYYMIIYDVFKDVRMVFAPPSSIGKFGGDTDNWMWPRHTGDFSVFRVYASKDNKPSLYHKDNVPYRPLYSATVSAEGYHAGDYAMTIGFPGSTERYIPSWGIENRMENENAVMIDARGVKQAIWRKAMDADQATRIKYSDKYARSSNYWKNSIGMNRGLERLRVLDRKRAEEAEFAAWTKTAAGSAYAEVLPRLEQAYKGRGADRRKLMALNETLMRGGTEVAPLAARVRSAIGLKGEQLSSAIEALQKTYKDYLPSLDRKVLPAMLDVLRKYLTAEEAKVIFAQIDSEFAGNTEAYAEYVFKNSIVPYENKVIEGLKSGSLTIEQLNSDPAMKLSASAFDLSHEVRSRLRKYDEDLSWGDRLYFAGRQQMNPERQMPSDANFTMRLSYGSIKGYSPSDAVRYSYFTSPRGILEKYKPGSVEFDLKPEFVELLKKGDWGRWVDKQTKKLQVAFLSNNDITGGNSGSPVFDRDGRVIGLAFDGNWEAMSGDIEFEPALQRTISVDIRYVLFVIERWGKCPRLIEELELK